MIDKDKVRELAKELRRCQFNFYEEIITEWLEQNQPEPIVTGLSDAGVDVAAYDNRIKELITELEKLKSQQFTPSWEDAPDDVVVCQNIIQYLNEKHEIRHIDLIGVKQRPKPTPEVGQVWKYQDSKYQIDSIGKVKMDEWGDCVTYRSLVNGKFYTRTLDDFMAKFVRVSDDN